jgi:prolyl 4-hydroxylase
VDAVNLLRQAMSNGSANAALTLARWRISGSYIRRDLGLARELFGQAATLGSVEAEGAYIALLANGAGGLERRWAAALDRLRASARKDGAYRRQLDLIAAMNLNPNGDPLSMRSCRPIRSDPHVQRFDAFLTPSECDYLISLALPLLRPSVVVHPVTQQLIQDPIRTSSAAGFPFIAENPVIHAINRRIAAASRTSYKQGEPMQILCYEPGQQYKLHSDALPADPNQRISTFLVYLNDSFEGGETIFPELHLTVKARAGEGLLFSNVDQAGAPHPAARHAGRPVLRGRKLLLSKWIRKNPLDLSGPPGRPL